MFEKWKLCGKMWRKRLYLEIQNMVYKYLVHHQAVLQPSDSYSRITTYFRTAKSNQEIIGESCTLNDCTSPLLRLVKKEMICRKYSRKLLDAVVVQWAIKMKIGVLNRLCFVQRIWTYMSNCLLDISTNTLIWSP